MIPEVRARVGVMQRDSLEFLLAAGHGLSDEINPSVAGRLEEIADSTLLLWGNLDVPDIPWIGERIAEQSRTRP